MKIRFRPHHFLCTLGFQGKGYSPEFINNFSQIVEILKAQENFPIEVVSGEDSICSVCPHQNQGMCDKEEKIQSLDNRHQNLLNISPGDTLSWTEAKRKLKALMSLEAFHKACEGCEWKSLGICEQALLLLRDGKS